MTLTPLTNQRGHIPSNDQLNGNTQCRVGHLVISFGATKLPAHPEVGDGVSSQNVGGRLPKKISLNSVTTKASRLKSIYASYNNMDQISNLIKIHQQF